MKQTDIEEIAERYVEPRLRKDFIKTLTTLTDKVREEERARIFTELTSEEQDRPLYDYEDPHITSKSQRQEQYFH